MKHTGPFPINQMFQDMKKVGLADLKETNVEAAAKHYGLTQETVRHWIAIVVNLKG